MQTIQSALYDRVRTSSEDEPQHLQVMRAAYAFHKQNQKNPIYQEYLELDRSILSLESQSISLYYYIKELKENIEPKKRQDEINSIIEAIQMRKNEYDSIVRTKKERLLELKKKLNINF